MLSCDFVGFNLAGVSWRKYSGGLQPPHWPAPELGRRLEYIIEQLVGRFLFFSLLDHANVVLLPENLILSCISEAGAAMVLKL